MSLSKPLPLKPQRVQPLCPVCGKASYSRGGIHPQCAVQQADEPRNVRLRLERKAQAEEKHQRELATADTALPNAHC